jgi:beta-ketoacyl synthase-like protein
MVERASPVVSDPVAVTGSGCCVLAAGEADALDVSRLLKSRKMRKFMGKQDQLAVAAAGGALEARGLAPEELRGRTGIYLTVGYIPFERADIEAMARHSVDGAAFSMQRFSTDGIDQVNPLLTFRCLPNMPAFHVSLNFGIQGPYFVTYPGAGQFYLALERAVNALAAREIDYALVGAVADQNNFLVEFDRARKRGAARAACDAGAMILLERAAEAPAGRPRLDLGEFELRYRPHDPWSGALAHDERFDPAAAEEADLGAASLPAVLHAALANGAANVAHRLATADGIEAASRWRLA